MSADEVEWSLIPESGFFFAQVIYLSNPYMLYDFGQVAFSLQHNDFRWVFSFI